MLKMEKTCNSLRCDVLIEEKLIGHMEGVNITQWFLKNQYKYKGSFSNFETVNPDDFHAGIIVDIVFQDKKLIAREARIEWINAFGKNGTFTASRMEYYDPSI